MNFQVTLHSLVGRRYGPLCGKVSSGKAQLTVRVASSSYRRPTKLQEVYFRFYGFRPGPQVSYKCKWCTADYPSSGLISGMVAVVVQLRMHARGSLVSSTYWAIFEIKRIAISRAQAAAVGLGHHQVQYLDEHPSCSRKCSIHQYAV